MNTPTFDLNNATVGSIYRLLSEIIPPALACDWDNVGILVGERDMRVKNAMVTLDVDLDVIAQAAALNCDLIVAHHPILLNPLKSFDSAHPDAAIVHALIKNGIALIVMHTNLDAAANGINQFIAERIGIIDPKPLERAADGLNGMGRIGAIKESMRLADYARAVKDALMTPCVRFIGEPDMQVRNVALVTGSGLDYLELAKKMGADLLVTGDLKYHAARDAQLIHKFPVIDAGHFPTERFVTEVFAKYLRIFHSGIHRAKIRDVFNYVF